MGLMNHLFKPVEDYISKKTTDYVRKNSKLHNNNYELMSFRGCYFSTGTAKTVMPQSSINLLHKDLRQEFKEFLKIRDRANQDATKIESFFQSLLLNLENFNELYEILPSGLHSTLNKYNQENRKDSLNSSKSGEIQAFKKENEHYLDLITQRLTYNLLDVSGY
jgi:hypothetical protein